MLCYLVPIFTPFSSSSNNAVVLGHHLFSMSVRGALAELPPLDFLGRDDWFGKWSIRANQSVWQD